MVYCFLDETILIRNISQLLYNDDVIMSENKIINWLILSRILMNIKCYH